VPTHPDRHVSPAHHAATVAEAMSRGVIRCSPDTALRDVAHLMAARNVHAVFVYDFGDEPDDAPELVGVVSDLDLMAAVRDGVDERTAGDSAITPVVTVMSADRLEDAARLMAVHGVSHLVVFEPGSDRPMGVLSTLDVARAVSTDVTFTSPAARRNDDLAIGLGMD